MDFGAKLKELRTQAGLTQQQLGNQIGLSKTVISYYELHERTPSPEVLIKLAAVFHVSADYLLCELCKKVTLNAVKGSGTL